MDMARANDLFVEILREIKTSTRLLCRFSGALPDNRGCRVKVGHDEVFLELCPVGGPMTLHDRCSLLIKTPLTKAKRFRETKAGWFAVSNVSKYIFEALQREQGQRQIQARQRQLYSTARNGIQRLMAEGLPEGVSLVPSASVPGTLDIVVLSLPETGVKQLLKTVEALRAPADQAGLWDHLRSDDEA